MTKLTSKDFADIGEKLDKELAKHNYQVAPKAAAGKPGKVTKNAREYRLQLINKTNDTSAELIKRLDEIILSIFQGAKQLKFNQISANSSKFPSYSFTFNDQDFDIIVARGANKGENFETNTIGNLAAVFGKSKTSKEFQQLIDQLNAANKEFANREIVKVYQRTGQTKKEGVPIDKLGAIIGDIVLEDQTGEKWFISLKDTNGNTFSSYSGAASLFNQTGDLQPKQQGAIFLESFGADLNLVQSGFDDRNKKNKVRIPIETKNASKSDIKKIFERAWGMNYFYVRKISQGWKVFWIDKTQLDKMTQNITVKTIRYPNEKQKQISILCENSNYQYLIELRNQKAGEYPNDTKFKVV